MLSHPSDSERLLVCLLLPLAVLAGRRTCESMLIRASMSQLNVWQTPEHLVQQLKVLKESRHKALLKRYCNSSSQKLGTQSFHRLKAQNGSELKSISCPSLSLENGLSGKCGISTSTRFQPPKYDGLARIQQVLQWLCIWELGPAGCLASMGSNRRRKPPGKNKKTFN